MTISLLGAFIRGVVFPTLAIWVLGKYNIFDDISFVPADKKFDIGLTAYLASFECIYVYVWTKIKVCIISSRAEVKCIFWCAGTIPNISSMPHISFVEDTAHINVKVEVSGKQRRLIGNEIELSFPKWLDIQADNDLGINVDGHVCKIDIGEIIDRNNSIIEDTYHTFKISVIKNYSSSEYGTIIRPKLKKKLMCAFNSNKFKIN